MRGSDAKPRREEAPSASTRLRGVDLVEQIATDTTIQKQRWVEVYYRLWERKAKVDVADSIVIEDGVLRDWFFTSSATGEVRRKAQAHVNAIAIKKHFVRTGDSATIVRQIALLLHEDAGGNVVYSVLNDLDFNIALGQPASPPWTGSFLLQPFLPTTQQHAQHSGVYVGKFSASTTTSVRVLRSESCFYDLRRCGDDSQRLLRRAAQATTKPDRHCPPVVSRAVEELIRAETHKIVGETEAAAPHDSVRQLHAEFQITRSHRLVLVRVARIVFASDLKRVRRVGGSPRRTRPLSGAMQTRCAGSRFCHRKAVATGEINKTSAALKSKASDLQQITRRSLQLCEEESAFLDKFGAHAEARLDSVVARGDAAADAYEAFKRVLQRRMFMLRSTLWNPDSDSFGAKPLAWEDEKSKQPQQYEMVRVCHPCYLIYHAMDAERFQATKSTVKAAVRRLTMLHNAKLLGAKRAAWQADDRESS